MPHKSLACPFTRWVRFVIRQPQIVVSPGLVHRWTADLDDLETRRSFQHTMADFRRLQDAVAGVHNEWRALIFVDHTHPSGLAEDHLESDAVVMHVVGHLAAFRNPDMRSHEASA